MPLTWNDSPIELFAPRALSGKSVFDALQSRRTMREISDRPLPPQLLSNLLWAACGVNRQQGPFGGIGITAASASNSQEIELFVASPLGVYRFDARRHRLLPVLQEDVRTLTISHGQTNVTMRAPIQLIYVADLRRLTHTTGFQEPGLHDPEVQKAYYFVDTGLIAGNVYLFAASQGLGAWFHNCDKVALSQKLRLRPEQRVLFAQSVGYPESE